MRAAEALASGCESAEPLRESASRAAAAAAFAAMQTGSVTPAQQLNTYNTHRHTWAWALGRGVRGGEGGGGGGKAPSDDSRVRATCARAKGLRAASIATAVERSVSVVPNSRRDECVGRRP
jgi:hypothetical protein